MSKTKARRIRDGIRAARANLTLPNGTEATAAAYARTSARLIEAQR